MILPAADETTTNLRLCDRLSREKKAVKRRTGPTVLISKVIAHALCHQLVRANEAFAEGDASVSHQYVHSTRLGLHLLRRSCVIVVRVDSQLHKP